jgi:hypothetical protein
LTHYRRVATQEIDNSKKLTRQARRRMRARLSAGC